MGNYTYTVTLTPAANERFRARERVTNCSMEELIASWAEAGINRYYRGRSDDPVMQIPGGCADV